MLAFDAISKLLDVHSKIGRTMTSYAVLAEQTARVAEFVKKRPEVRIDWLDYAAGMRTAEESIEKALKEESELKSLLSEWVEENFTSHKAQAVKVNLEALGITPLAGVEVPLSVIENLGDGNFRELLSRVLSLGFSADKLQQDIEALERTQAETLGKVREVLKSHGNAYTETVRELDSVIAENRAHPVPKKGLDSGVLMLGLFGVWAGIKVWKWRARRIERELIREVARA
ncbi:MAG: hypothetical protein AB1405_16395 [Bdellovibrionota bacterium]